VAPEAGGSFSIVVEGAGEVVLAAYLARPAPSAAGGSGRHGLVLCHGFPVEPTESGVSDRSYHDLADRLAADTGWVVLTFSFRGTSRSTGNFSLSGWLSDLQSATDVLIRSPGVDAVWTCGFAAGGAPREGTTASGAWRRSRRPPTSPSEPSTPVASWPRRGPRE